MNIAIVTGASSGMGKKFAVALDNLDKYVKKNKAEKFDEIWVIARRKDRLEDIAVLTGGKVAIYELGQKL